MFLLPVFRFCPLRIEYKSLCSTPKPAQIIYDTQCATNKYLSSHCLLTILELFLGNGWVWVPRDDHHFQAFPLKPSMWVLACPTPSMRWLIAQALLYTKSNFHFSRLSAFSLSSFPRDFSLSSFPSLSYIFNFSAYTLGIFLWSINSLRCLILKSNSPSMVLSLLIFLLPSQPFLEGIIYTCCLDFNIVYLFFITLQSGFCPSIQTEATLIGSSVPSWTQP